MYRTLAALALGSLLWSVKSAREIVDQANLGDASIEKAKASQGDTSVEKAEERRNGCPSDEEEGMDLVPHNFRCPLFPQGMRGVSRVRFPTEADLREHGITRQTKFMICGMARPDTLNNPECGDYNKAAKQSEAGAIASILRKAEKRYDETRRLINAQKKNITLLSLDAKEIDTISAAATSRGWHHDRDHIFRDFSSPSAESLNKFVTKVLAAEPDMHFIVHCGGGMGRTGIFLVALYIRLFQMSGNIVFEDYERSLVAASHPVPYTEWYQPLDEATVWVMSEYNMAAAEFLEVESNYDALVNFMVPNIPDGERPQKSDITAHKCDFFRTTTHFRVISTGGRGDEGTNAKRELMEDNARILRKHGC